MASTYTGSASGCEAMMTAGGVTISAELESTGADFLQQRIPAALPPAAPAAPPTPQQPQHIIDVMQTITVPTRAVGPMIKQQQQANTIRRVTITAKINPATSRVDLK
jgi:hypothetical protein